LLRPVTDVLVCSIDCGYDHPDQTVKAITTKSTQKLGTLSLGLTNAHPTVADTASYGETRGKTVEKADNKVSF
jgi:hypothetical protein